MAVQRIDQPHDDVRIHATPAVIESLIETIRGFAAEGTALLVVEQKLGVATALAERQLVRVGGQIAAETTAAELQDDPDAQRRYLGVEPIATEE